MGWSARKTGRRRDPAGLAAEPGHDLRRADPVVVETSLLDGVTGEAPEVQAGLPAHRGVERRHARGDAEEEAGLLVGDDDLAARVQGGERLSGPRAVPGRTPRPARRRCRGRAGAGSRARRPPPWTATRPPARGRLARQVETSRTATASSVTGSRTATPAQTHSSKPVHQCSGPLISTGSGRLERGAHPVRPRRPLRPARPRRHVALARAAQRLLVALDGQDPTRAVGDGDDAAEALDLARDRRRGAAELGEHDLVLERVLGGRLVLRGRRRGLASGPGRRGTARDSDTRTWPPRAGPPARGRRRRESVRALRSPLGTAPRRSCDDAVRSGSRCVRTNARHPRQGLRSTTGPPRGAADRVVRRDPRRPATVAARRGR